MPMGKPMEEWSFGDLEAGFKQAALVLDETFVVPSTGHHPLETRSAMAYWQNGKLHLHCSTQSVVRTVDAVARWVGIKPGRRRLDLRIHRRRVRQQGRRARLDGHPRVVVEEGQRAGDDAREPRGRELYRPCPDQHGRRASVGFADDGRITRARSVHRPGQRSVCGPMGDHRSAGNAASLVYQPAAMRWRAVNVLTNTPPRTQQRSPGPMQANGICEGVITKAAEQLGIDQVAIRRINSPEGKANYGPPDAKRPAAAHHERVREGRARSRCRAIRLAGARRARRQTPGSKVRGVGVAVGPHAAGSIGFDGLMTSARRLSARPVGRR